LTPKKEGNRIPSAVKAAQHNANSSFDLEKSVAGAKKLAEVMEFEEAYWRKQLDILTAQLAEVRIPTQKPGRADQTRHIENSGRQVESDTWSTCAWREQTRWRKRRKEGSVSIEVATNTNHLRLPTSRST
jgi:hypothetical protein